MRKPESRSDFYNYFLRELNFLKEEGLRFSKKYPSEAKFLNIEAVELLDPHVERLIETFCFMTAKVQRNIDMEYPSLIAYLANFLYPNIASPVPPSSILHIEPDIAQGIGAKGSLIPAKSQIETATDTSGTFEFRTVYPTTLWPIKIAEIKSRIANTQHGLERFGNLRMISVDLAAMGLEFQNLEMNRLRFYINSDDTSSNELYESLFTSLKHVVLTKDDKIFGVLAPNAVHSVGFELDQLMLNMPSASQNSLSLLYDYCYFDKKFMFFDVVLPKITVAGFELSINFIFDDNRELSNIKQDTLLLNCTPVINVSTLYSIPFSLHDKTRVYRVIPDTNKPELLEIHSIEHVYLTEPGKQTQELPSIFDYSQEEDKFESSWFFERSDLSDQAKQQSTFYLSFLDKKHGYYINERSTAYAMINCVCVDTQKLLEHSKQINFKEAYPVKNIHLVAPITKFYKPLFGSDLTWCLYSYLRFNQISLCESNSGAVIRDIVRAVNRYSDNVLEHNIRSLKDIKISESATFVRTGFYLATVRGYDVDLEFNTDDFSGGSPYLLSSVIEKYLSNLIAINSFSRVGLFYSNRNLKVKQWPARIGKISLI